jgi:UDP-N-acetylglucosamine transferase subunit ALG13
VIFVTTGTHHLPFNRLLTMMSEVSSELPKREKVIIQSGESRVFVMNAEIVPYFSYQDMIKHITQARVVISAAGPATIFQVLAHGQALPIVVPRLKKYGEHVSNHQVDFANFLSRKSLCNVADNRASLCTFLHSNNRMQSETKLLPSKVLLDKLRVYLNNNLDVSKS